MLTIFSIPKPFRGHIRVIQRNALQSWTKLGPGVEVILFGDEEGVAENAREFGVRHCPEVARTPYGTPLLDSVFAHAATLSGGRPVCYVNADIILLDDLLGSLARIRYPRFLLVGSRWDVDLDHSWNFEDADWRERLRRFVADKGAPHPPSGSDYFLFPPDGQTERLPPLAVGRPGWDGWMIRHGRRLGIPVIDGSRSVFAIHQNHDYSHVPKGNGTDYFGPEAEHNFRLIDEPVGNYDLLDCTHLLMPAGVRRALTRQHIDRRCFRMTWMRAVKRRAGWARRLPRRILKHITPPALVILARKVLRRRSVPVAATPATPGRHEWEYVPEGWSAQQKDPLIKGWNIGSILDSYKKNWPVFLANIQGPGPLGISPESSSAQRDNVILHNIMMTYAYVLSRAARKKDTLSLLDWGGSIGHYYLLARTLAPDVVIDYHCKDLPVLVEHGRTLFPDLHFHADESCLERTYDLVLACSSLHYSPDWRSTLRKLGAATAGHLFITGLPTVRDAASFVYVQRPYHYGYDTEYLGWCLNRDEFLAAAQSAGLQLLREFVVGHKPMIHNAPEQNEFFGFLFQASTAGTQT